MSTSLECLNYIVAALKNFSQVTYLKMFGEYMIYINGKPLILVCDNTAFIKKYVEIAQLMLNAEEGYPYKGAKLHYILDIDDAQLTVQVITILDKIIAIKPKKSSQK
ncbi:MAG: hypothetical protein LBV55_01740 [Acholeplasmatales bacterium]|jgi:TfoX/Sxy family transcriptional regulator of competence genes|nr:hypothetical protein [Acholeplasmatales bacterium]